MMVVGGRADAGDTMYVSTLMKVYGEELCERSQMLSSGQWRQSPIQQRTDLWQMQSALASLPRPNGYNRNHNHARPGWKPLPTVMVSLVDLRSSIRPVATSKDS